MNAIKSNEDKILRSPAVQAMTGLSRSSLWRLEQKGQFVKRVKLSERACGWRQSEVLNWIETR